jgi:hypothetical protein
MGAATIISIDIKPLRSGMIRMWRLGVALLALGLAPIGLSTQAHAHAATTAYVTHAMGASRAGPVSFNSNIAERGAPDQGSIHCVAAPCPRAAVQGASPPPVLKVLAFTGPTLLEQVSFDSARPPATRRISSVPSFFLRMARLLI